MFPEEDIKKALEEMLFKHEFELPLTFVLVGVNGTILTGRIEVSIIDGPQITVKGEASKLRFPINLMIIDQKGKAGHVAFSMTGEEKEVTEPIVCFAGKKYD
jgi:hypothetical protein